MFLEYSKNLAASSLVNRPSPCSCRLHLRDGWTPPRRHPTVTITFPRACPASRYRMASEMSRRGKHRSMTGVTVPAFISADSVARSSLAVFAMNPTSRWLTNQDSTICLIMSNTSSNELVSRPSPSDPDVDTLRAQDTPARRQRAIPHAVEEQVVSLLVSGEVLVRVVDDVVRAEGSREVHVPRAADARHLRTERFGDLHGEGAHASRSSVDEDALSRLEPSMVAEPLQCREPRDWNAGRLLEREAIRLDDQC